VPAVAERQSLDDSLPARESGVWAREKLDILERYAQITTKAMRRKFKGGLVFIDLMSGPGRCVEISRDGPTAEFPGSTVRALSTPHPFDRVYAVDSNPSCVAVLQARVARTDRAATCICRCADSNSADVVKEVRDLTRDSLSLMFVDLLGTEVHFETIKKITHERRIDLLITWPEMDVVRNQQLMLTGPDRWDAFYGVRDWRSISQGGPTRRATGLRDLYAKQLATLGYRTVFLSSMKNQRGGRLYRPLGASKHELGLDFFRKADTRVTHSLPLG
jgi:three-Cys-motif partner protein